MDLKGREYTRKTRTTDKKIIDDLFMCKGKNKRLFFLPPLSKMSTIVIATFQ